jgi:hypothetical protein
MGGLAGIISSTRLKNGPTHGSAETSPVGTLALIPRRSEALRDGPQPSPPGEGAISDASLKVCDAGRMGKIGEGGGPRTEDGGR